MRILYCVGTLETGGLERFVTRVSIMAKERQLYEPVVLCLHKKKGMFLSQIEEAGINVHEAPGGWNRNPQKFFQLVSLIRKIKPVVVHSQVNFSLVQQYLAAKLSGAKQFMVTERSCYVMKGFNRFRRILQFHILHMLGVHYSANGVLVAKYLARLVMLGPDKIEVIPNGVDVFIPDSTIRSQIRLKCGFDANDLVIGYVGRITAGKGHHNFLAAIVPKLKEDPSLKICIVGDGPEREAIESEVRDAGVSGSVLFTGIVNNVNDYLASFDLVALLSEREGMPNVILEAMAVGVPVIATAVGSIPDLLDQGRVGVLVTDRSIESYSTALKSLISDEQRREALGKAGKEWIGQNYSLNNTMRLLMSYYQKAA